MVSGRQYRIISAVGTICATIGALLIANTPLIQTIFTTYVPLVWRLQPTTLEGTAFGLALLTTVIAVGIAVAPLYKPQPRRILNIIYQSQRRVILAGLALAAVGYFDYTYRLPRIILIITISIVLVVLPGWFISIRRRPDGDGERTLIVGDDPTEIRKAYDALGREPVGYVGPSVMRADGGLMMENSPDTIGDAGRVGGLSRLADILVEYEIDTAVFAFAETDRGEFFGALGTCHDHGVDAMIRREKADSVLVADNPGEDLLAIDVEPWDWQERIIKRGFDITFATAGLITLSPMILLIAVSIKLDDGGQILYRQERTAELGKTFHVYKFRSMIENAESQTGAKLSEEDRGDTDPRVTRVGRILRMTHLDEIPQLWSILVGDMSVVGPRPERPELDSDIEETGIKWQQRWFVKPGLTGLAQINNVTGHNPVKKLRYDVEYIRRQSIRYDVAIVIRQIWQVLLNIITMLTNNNIEKANE